jgi:lysine 6-dehydrogenase
MAIIYVKLCGIHNGKQAVRYIQLIDYFDEKTGFTAMERLTGWHCAIIMQLQVDKKISPGAKPVELAVDPQLIIDEFAKRKMRLAFSKFCCIISISYSEEHLVRIL